ncbi:single-stranded-DNA-specific exonuclease RecJ [Virgibacillus oceani]|uniref:Single-stranded-DNA-specific exonuclease RecJ n=1 Tax=Virgibacillus oceani TaxID=1479511 RepID=A0A917LWQ1_9BACI|nr:single-stranded-DNA-specific exonuclease RecJ [Virgibacillus oceani]GGG62689.1 single-stranded-DNA-specific exonuclease [Virgibacillus oceani]
MLQSKATWKFTTIQDNINQWTDDTNNNLSPVIKELLLQRGINTAQDANEFLSPSLDNLFTPKGFASIDKAAERVHKAIEHNEKILIYGDYDADGVSSTAVILKALQELGAEVDFYIPNRFTEGYGPNETAFRQAYERGYRLIITVDTGIASVHEANVAKELDIDLIITDHHEPQDTLPDAFAIVHPKCSPDYPFKELAGVGVAFKFAEHLLGYFPEHLLDLAAIGTIADLVPLVSENRILAYYGLRKLTVTNRHGLNALKKLCKIEGNVTEEDVGFLIGPRLNAVGRLQDADLAVQLLLTDDPNEAEELAEMIQDLNKERQKIVADIVKEAEKMVQPIENNGVIIVAKEGWNEGVLGIVASRLVRKYDRPAIVLAVNPENESVKGSARSIPAFDLFKNCMKVRSLFTSFGGHAQAAGMTLPLNNLQRLQDELNIAINDQLTKEDFKQVIEISKTLAIPEMNETLVNEINRLAPFGMANPKPIFHLKETPTDIRQLGNMKKHLKVQFRQDAESVEGIGFGFGSHFDCISQQTPVSLVGELGINEWNGNKKVQIVIQDIKIDEWQLFDYRGKKDLDILPIVKENEDTLIVCSRVTEIIPKQANHLIYGAGLDTLSKLNTLFIYDLPDSLTDLKEIIKKTKPSRIYACYHVEDSSYMKVFPTRDDFKWFYALIRTKKIIDLNKEIDIIKDRRAWTQDLILFMSKVFFELEFVTIVNGILKLNPNPAKKDLQESKVFQQRLNQAEIEKTLYYSNYDKLKEWFSTCIDVAEVPKEEPTHGLQKIY